MSTSARRRLMRDFKVRLIQVAATETFPACVLFNVSRLLPFWMSRHIPLLPT